MPQPAVGRHYAQVSPIFKLPAVFTTNHRPKGAIRYSRSGGESDSLSEMRWIPIALVGVHGLIHLMGFAKGFGFADLPQLTQPISRGWGLAWLIAALLVTTTTAMLVVGARSYSVDIAAKSLRKAKSAITEQGAAGVNCLVQGKLGVDQREMEQSSFRYHAEIMKRMRKADAGGMNAVKGVFKVSKVGQERLTQLLFPAPDAPTWQRRVLQGLISAADRGDRWLASRHAA